MHARELALLEQDVAGIQTFLDRFEPPANQEHRTAEVNSTGEAVIIKNMPLPDGLWPDFIDVLILVDQYPSRPPVGLYLLERQNAQVIAQIRQQFVVMGQPVHGAPSIPGFAWICVHYSGLTWKYNPSHLAKGDNLAKFIEFFFNRLQSDLEA